MGFEWTGMSYQEKQVGSEAIIVFALAIVLVFLVFRVLSGIGHRLEL
jgi:HAE1 family hydrophobic/amphiphilic exporter-1